MMTGKHDRSTEETSEWASLYALGALPLSEAQAFEEHLQGCAVCRGELDSFREAAASMALTSKPVRSPEHLRARLLERVRLAEPAEQGVLMHQAGLLISRSAAMPWQTASLLGVFSKPLFVDEARKYSTSLVRMEPGTRYPSHRHTEVEELYLLEGDLHLEGLVMRAGDYCRAEPDSIHGEVFTESGALFLVLASQKDELLLSRPE